MEFRNRPIIFQFWRVLLLFPVWLGWTAQCYAETDSSFAPQDQDSLKPMLEITWERGPNLPQGFQDSDGGIVDSCLVTVGGFCDGRGVPEKPNTNPRGFINKVWGIELHNQYAQWHELPPFPGDARQEHFSIVVNHKLYAWGGFSYSEPYSYSDGYCLSKQEGKWHWEKLPSLPWPVCSSGICSIGERIFVFGGADYDKERFYTLSDRGGKIPRLGSRLLMLDTSNLEQGWVERAPCPGTPRWVMAMTQVDGAIYVIGGATGDQSGVGDFPYCSVVDNWRYWLDWDHWERIRNLPVSSGNFPSGAIVFDNRFILLVGGYQYTQIANPDGTYHTAYRNPFKAIPDREYYSDMWVYDTKTEQFGLATPLPLNNNLPMTVVEDDRIYLIGGETGGSTIEGERYAHHPDLFLIGAIREVKR